MVNKLIVAGTGHRPEDCEDEAIVRRKARTQFVSKPIGVFITGMAAGFDLWAGEEALKANVEIWCAKPWAGHEPRKGDEELYESLINNAAKVVDVTNVQEFPGAWCYHRRNEWMVDHATAVMAYLNPARQSGGTFACVNYAKSKSVPIRNIYGDAPF